MASHDTLEGKPAALDRPVLLDRFERILRARGDKAAAGGTVG